MCGVSGIEFMVILVVAVIVLGPDRLPEAMRTLGKMARELRKITDDFSDVRDEFTKGMRDDIEKSPSKSNAKSSASKLTANRRAKAGRAGQDVPDIDAIRAKRDEASTSETSDKMSDAGPAPLENSPELNDDAAAKRPRPALTPAAGLVESQSAAPTTAPAANADVGADAPTGASATKEPDNTDSDSGKDV